MGKLQKNGFNAMKSGLEGKLSSLWTIRYWSVGKGAVTASRTPQDQDRLALLPTCCNRLNGCCVTIGLTLSTINPAVGVAKAPESAVRGWQEGDRPSGVQWYWASSGEIDSLNGRVSCSRGSTTKSNGRGVFSSEVSCSLVPT